MTPENTPIGPGSVEPLTYYVEDADGSDFTFYLLAEPNAHLLASANQEVSTSQPCRQFSKALPLQLVKLPIQLREKDLKCSSEELLKLFEEATAKPETPAGILAGRLRSGLLGGLKAPALSKTKIVEVINQLLKDDNGNLLTATVDQLSGAELELFNKLPPDSQRTFNNRRKFDQLFPEAFRSLSLSEPIHGRALVCSSYRGNFLSVSFREKNDKLSFEPNSDRDGWPLCIEDYCGALAEVLKPLGPPPMHGLLVIAGATNSSKSEITTGLIFNYLKDLKATARRRPHLVTFEDPIEKYYVTFGDSMDAFRADVAQRELKGLSVKMPASLNGVDYTPREKDSDCSDDRDAGGLRTVLEDALRQTPSVFFVGETRKRRDWRQLVDFAGTGHLIVTTTHAGSLTEAMRKIFEALSVETPSQRNEIANRLLAVIHLRTESTARLLLPAVWRRTQTGTNTLTAEGLSSLLPHQPRTEGKNVDASNMASSRDHVGCLGRSWFATRLLKVVPRKKMTAHQRAALTKIASTWDLEGV